MPRNLHTLTYQLFLTRPSYEEALKGLEGLTEQEASAADARLQRLYAMTDATAKAREYATDISQYL